MGYSFGGYYSSRIAAFEKRYAACIALSALHWDLAGWQIRIKEKNRSAPKSVAPCCVRLMPQPFSAGPAHHRSW